MWKIQNSQPLLVGKENRAVTLENNLSASQKIQHKVTIWPRNSTPGYTLKKYKKHKPLIQKDTFPHHHVHQFSSVAQLCPTLCDPMNCSTPGLPVHHQLPESTQIHVHWVGDAIQPSHPLSSPSPPALNLSQHQDLFKWVSSSHHVAKVLELQL